MVVRICRAPGWRIVVAFTLSVALVACGGVLEMPSQPFES
jgi:hypothetical protein